MVSAKEEVASLLERLPDDCSLEDVRYHLHVLAKVRRGLASAEREGAVEQEEAEERLSRWLTG
jgi:predicted transcriptional regulator